MHVSGETVREEGLVCVLVGARVEYVQPVCATVRDGEQTQIKY